MIPQCQSELSEWLESGSSGPAKPVVENDRGFLERVSIEDGLKSFL
jgi:hypothetical protein